MDDDTTARRLRRLPLLLLGPLLAMTAGVRHRGRDEDPERGDVPGWVMVTVMTAVLVVVIIGIFEPQIRTALSGIIDSVSTAGKNN